VISSNYDSIRQDIITSLEMLRDTPAREEVCDIDVYTFIHMILVATHTPVILACCIY
jgi:hypothetical protein